jgi:hypothetical protein
VRNSFELISMLTRIVGNSFCTHQLVSQNCGKQFLYLESLYDEAQCGELTASITDELVSQAGGKQLL